MATTFLEAGTDATYDFKFWAGTEDSVTVESSIVHTGPRSIKLVNGAQASRISSPNGSLTASAGRVSFWVRCTNNPGSTQLLVQFREVGAGTIASLKITSSGVLQLFDVNGQLGSDGAVVPTGTWMRIVFAYKIVSTNIDEARVFQDGTLTITSSAAKFDANQFNNMRFLAPGDATYLDDIYVDDSNALTDPGDIRVTAKLPASTNTAAFDATVGNGNVNERALSETNGMRDTSVLGHQQNYTLETAAAGDVDLTGATLVARSAWIWAKITVASVLAKIMDNGTETGVTLTTTPALYTLITDSASYPSNAAGIGAKASTTADTYLYECGTLIAYIPGAGASDTSITVGCP